MLKPPKFLSNTQKRNGQRKGQNRPARRNVQTTRSNPISFNTRLGPALPGIPRVTRGKDIIVAEVQETTSFVAKQYDLNPRLPSVFPSAHLAAQRYDMYEFEELEFHYHPTRAVTDTAGVVFLGWEPNANRGPPQNITEINAYEYHVEGPAYSPNIVLRVGKAHLPPPRYCRATPTASDLNLYDTGTLIVATDAFATGAINQGYVEVFYKIKFYNYHIADTLAKQSRLCYFDIPTLSGVTAAADTAIPLDMTEDFGRENNGWTSEPGVGEFVLPAGKYLLNLACTATSSLNDITKALIKLTKDGVTQFEAISGDAPAAGANFLTPSMTQLLVSSGVEVFKIWCNLDNSAAGTLSIRDGSASIAAL